MKIHLTKTDWLTTIPTLEGRLKVIGIIAEQEKLLSILKMQAIENITEALNDLTGFFSLAFQTEEKIIAAVDHIRSHPLFYGQKEGKFFLSDQAEWVRQQVGDEEMNLIAKEEFQVTGYVTGRDTLFPNVKQLQAGEMLVYENEKLYLHRYYVFNHVEPESYNEEQLLSQLHELASRAIQRLIKYANGRQIVVPLSGGYDSRLIATLLKEAKYPNILTFTYGTRGSKEAVYSKRVAESLGLKWHFVEYTEKLWREWNKAEYTKAYRDYNSNKVSLPHLQDAVAIHIMKNSGILEDNAVFAPGHCCVTGYIPRELLDDSRWEEKKTKSNLMVTHFNLKPFVKKDFYLKNLIDQKLDYFLEGDANKYFWASRIMQFNWEERQSKFISNSVRVYEYYGFDWWQPLWDQEFVSFWEKVPLKFRVERNLYINYVSELFETNSGISNLKNGNDSNGFFFYMKKQLSKNKIIKFISKSIYSYFNKEDAFGWFGQFPYKERRGLTKRGYSYNAIVAYFFIKDLQLNLNNSEVKKYSSACQIHDIDVKSL